ncbi:gluconate 2-dehydrogenase subunit 3 family protein [Ammoniphilus sp. CFH 90114]|uniref:gluconate 2-dehydrogenase subunit 3 family protein n=1 Tax=Ammoniphilus sp. CFH 90114 TaxID=2493665 RepID=UPI00100E2232|nr:gluconate 2-dehydrogenase subunit 3 family protein [Ammoniphilus sp. CFH 90114]RXT08136.1 gluconate 2-dehydrogenase subunit 3 family protein [Ammoniphilus sp. CFH 90114]
MEKETHYPTYDVMQEKDHWDDHTRSIVQSRWVRSWDYQFLILEEVEMVHAICAHLAGDTREELISFVVRHIDESLHHSPGEGQRKIGVPKAQILIREGLRALNESCRKVYLLSFIQLDHKKQGYILDLVSRAQAPDVPEWRGLPQVEWFKKLLSWTIEAYYSHPQVWSEMGYGGPAYPRGYVRTQLGQLDPWEAQPK